jgi:hypothetical protein
MPTPAGTPPAGQPSTNPAAALLPPGVTDPRAFVAALRKRATAFGLSPLTAATAKQYEDWAKSIEDALQPTPDQKNAASVKEPARIWPRARSREGRRAKPPADARTQGLWLGKLPRRDTGPI